MKLLTDKQMLEPIWQMGKELEKQGKEPSQLDRFRAIAQAQLDQDKSDCASCKKQIAQEIEEGSYVEDDHRIIKEEIYQTLKQKWSGDSKEEKNG